MEVLGFVVIVVIVLAVVGSVGNAPATPARRPPPAGAAAAGSTTSGRAGLSRRATAGDGAASIGDEAFFDGVLFSHYFIDDAHDEDTAFDDPYGDDMDFD